MENRIFVVYRTNADYEEDDDILISAKDLEECKQMALNHNWRIDDYNKDEQIKLENAIKNFKEEDLNKIDYNAVIYIVEKTGQSGVLHVSNRGA